MIKTGCGAMFGWIIALSVSLGFGAELFKDDFSDCSQTNLKWVSSSDSLVRNCSGGVYTITNKDTRYAGLVYHTFNTKPSVYTVTVKIVSRSGDTCSAGLWADLNISNVSGYALQLNRVPWIQLTKYAGGSGSPMFTVTSGGVLAGSNEILLSRKGDSLVVYCNKQFVQVSVDNTSHAAGDLALIIPAGGSAVFDDIVVTDTFTPPPRPRTCFRDEFNGTVLSFDWQDYGDKDTKGLAGGNLRIGTMATGASAYPYVALSVPDTFVFRMYVSHHSGNKTGMYGLFLAGEPVGGSGSIPMALFGITGDRKCDAFIAGDSIKPFASSAIKGAAYISGTDTTYYWDTIEVIKKSNQDYRIMANGMLLDSLASAKVNFAISSAGIFADQGIDIWVDFFFIGKDTSDCPVLITSPKTRQYTYVRFMPKESRYLVDPLGRVIRIKDYYGGAHGRTLVPGYYIAPNGKNGIVLKKK